MTPMHSFMLDRPYGDLKDAYYSEGIKKIDEKQAGKFSAEFPKGLLYS